MGVITVATRGSFPYAERSFSSQHSGHAQAVAATIKWLADVVLPRAIKLDHKLHVENVRPTDKTFGPLPK